MWKKLRLTHEEGKKATIYIHTCDHYSSNSTLAQKKWNKFNQKEGGLKERTQNVNFPLASELLQDLTDWH